MATGTVITGTGNTSPTWSGALGSGWVKCTYSGSVTLDTRAGGYCAVVYSPATSKGYTQSYTFPVTSGILTAPASGTGNSVLLYNGPYNTAPGPAAMPDSSGASGTHYDWFTDIEVTTSGAPPAATLNAGGGSSRLTETYRFAR